MKIIYLDCGMGASGDMLMGALSELTDQKKFMEVMNTAGIKDVSVQAAAGSKCGIVGTHMEVKVHGREEAEEIPHTEEHHHHASMEDIRHMISSLHVSDAVKKNAIAVYTLIAEAESKVHGVPVSEIHFHEVGMKDAVADVVGCCVLMEMIKADRVYASNIAVGSGRVKCAHGILPVPAPATALLLQGIPAYAGDIKGELCTPTGAALLKYFVDSFEEMPVMTAKKIGYGLGTKDFEAANVLRAFLGESDDHGEVVELICNIDDQSPEEIGYAEEVLFAHGALDVYTISAQMKKNRPGILFACTCRQRDKDEMLKLMFTHLTTLGIRENVCRRHAMKREIECLQTSLGEVHLKRSSGYGVVREKIEYRDLAAIADQNEISIAEARERIKKERKEK